MAVEATELIFQKVASLHSQALKSIYNIKKLTSTSEEIIISDERTRLSHESINIIQQMRDLLSVVDLEVNGDEEMEIVFLYEKWTEKLGDLRLFLRETQLNSFEDEIEYTNVERVSKFSNEFRVHLTEEDLFKGRSNEKEEAGKNVNQQILMKNKKITSSLQQSKHMMETSIIQSELNLDELEQQTKDVQTLNDKYSSFNQMLQVSNKLVNLINEQDKNDRRMIRFSLYLFFAVVGWILWRRIFRRPIMFLIWSFFKIFDVFGWLSRLGDKNTEETIQHIYSEILASTSDGIESLIETALTTIVEQFATETSVTQVVEIVADEL